MTLDRFVNHVQANDIKGIPSGWHTYSLFCRDCNDEFRVSGEWWTNLSPEEELEKHFKSSGLCYDCLVIRMDIGINNAKNSNTP